MEYRIHNNKISGLIDGSIKKWGQKIGDHEIMKPDRIIELCNETIFISSFVNKEEILRNLKSLNNNIKII